MLVRTPFLIAGLLMACTTTAMAQFGPTLPGTKHVQVDYMGGKDIRPTHTLWINGEPTVFHSPISFRVPDDKRLIITDIEVIAYYSNEVPENIQFDMVVSTSGTEVIHSIHHRSSGNTSKVMEGGKPSLMATSYLKGYQTGSCFAPGTSISWSCGPNAIKWIIMVYGYYNPVPIHAGTTSIVER